MHETPQARAISEDDNGRQGAQAPQAPPAPEAAGAPRPAEAGPAPAAGPQDTEETGPRIVADRELCCGSGQCALVAPGVFDQDEVDGTVLVLEPRPGPERRAEVAEAVDLCPAGAIRLV